MNKVEYIVFDIELNGMIEMVLEMMMIRVSDMLNTMMMMMKFQLQ